MKDFASDFTEQIESSYCSITRVRESVMCLVCACEGDEKERRRESGSERAEGERNIFSTVGRSPSGAALPTQGSRDRQASAPF